MASHAPVHAHIHTPTAESTTQGNRVSSSGAVRVRCLAQGKHNNQLAGAGDRTSDLPVTSQPALPPGSTCHSSHPPTSFLFSSAAYPSELVCMYFGRFVSAFGWISYLLRSLCSSSSNAAPRTFWLLVEHLQLSQMDATD